MLRIHSSLLFINVVDHMVMCSYCATLWNQNLQLVHTCIHFAILIALLTSTSQNKLFQSLDPLYTLYQRNEINWSLLTSHNLPPPPVPPPLPLLLSLVSAKKGYWLLTVAKLEKKNCTYRRFPSKRHFL